jgi:hypothetical protein
MAARKAPYKKLGLDRATTATQSAFGAGGGALVTDDISNGEVVEVVIESGNGTAAVKPRRVGAVPISVALDSTNEAWNWSISGTTLTVNWTAGTPDGVIHFWVF